VRRLRNRWLPGSLRALPSRRPARRLLHAARESLRAHPCSCPDEDAPDRALPGPASSARSARCRTTAESVHERASAHRARNPMGRRFDESFEKIFAVGFHDLRSKPCPGGMHSTSSEVTLHLAGGSTPDCLWTIGKMLQGSRKRQGFCLHCRPCNPAPLKPCSSEGDDQPATRLRSAPAERSTRIRSRRTSTRAISKSSEVHLRLPEPWLSLVSLDLLA
jgi:hypothetical protein